MKKFYIALAIVLVVALIGWFLPVSTIVEKLGGSVHNIFETFDAGIGVDGDMVITGDGYFITRGSVYDYGETGSVSFGTDQAGCKYNFITLEPFEAALNPDSTGASISFPDDATMTAVNNCIENQGDSVSFTIDNTASTATAYLDFVTTGYIMDFASAQQTDFSGETLILVEALNVDGSSISWNIDVIEASISYQPQ